MITNTLYRRLVPDAPLYRRTDPDPVAQRGFQRARFMRSAVRPTPGLKTPRLISSWQGQIQQILFAFPAWAVSDPNFTPAYRSVITALRPGTEFVAVHHASERATVEEWFRSAGHTTTVTYVPLPDYVHFTDWAEDAYVALVDAEDGTPYLMEPWKFFRAGDALIADAVEEHTSIQASQAPLIFQGGNCLIGDDFWFLGTDYFADSVALLGDDQRPVAVPEGTNLDDLAQAVFREYVDAGRELILIGTRKPIPVRPFQGRREGDRYSLDVPSEGVGTFQPIFHIDMFLTLVGRQDGRFTVLVGDPSLADEILGTSSPYGLDDVYDQVADTLSHKGFDVRRNPLVHRPTSGETRSLADLRRIAQEANNPELMQATGELAAAGARGDTAVTVRNWHHITWNNCLVENSAEIGRHVYLPTFGHGDNGDLAVVDEHMTRLWEELGFTVHALADFNPLAKRQGVVHCIKKYLRRGG